MQIGIMKASDNLCTELGHLWYSHLYFLYNNYWDKFLHKMLHVRHVAKGNLRVCYVNETSRFPYYSEIYV